MATGLLLLLCCCATLSIQAQTNTHAHCGSYVAPIPGSPGNELPLNDSHFYFDRFGNQYGSLNIDTYFPKDPGENQGNGKETVVPGNPFSTPDCQSAGGLFNLFVQDIQDGTGVGFDDPANVAYFNVLCQVFSDLDALINQAPNPCGGNAEGVNIMIQSFADGSTSTGGSASAYYEYFGESLGVKHSEMWRGINTGLNDPNDLDGFIRLNFAFPWYTGLGGTVPSTQVDLYSVMLHEVLHTLGFASLISETGGSKLQFISGTPVLTNYSPFDQFLQLSTGTPLIANSGGYNWAYNGTNAAVELTSGCQNPSPMGPDVRFIGVFNPSSPVHAPATWADGSSLSHYEINCDGTNTDDYVMNAGIGFGISRRITQEEVWTLCDLGYRLSGTFGTGTVAGGGSNPNQQNFTACGVLFAAGDDTGPCCQGNFYTMDRCSGSTLTITPAELLCNDQGTGTLTIVNFEDAGTGIALTPSGSDFVYTPNRVGTIALRYQLQDQAGNLSNYAYVYINVFPCSGDGCVNTSLCNQICNPDLEDTGGDCNPGSCLANIAVIPQGCLEGWLNMAGQPFYWSPPFCVPTAGFTYLPNNAGGEFFLSAAQLNSTVRNWAAEMTTISLTAGQRYQLSVFAEQITNSSNPQPNGILNIGGFFRSDINWPLNQILAPAYPANHQLFGQPQMGSTSQLWQQYQYCFTAQDDYDILFLQATVDGDGRQNIHVDQIELVPDGLFDIRTEHNVFCEQTVLIGDDLCALENQFYSWWDVTDADPANHFQISFGGNMLGTFNGLVLANANGTQLAVTATRNRLFELRREIVGLQGVPVNNFGCFDFNQVAVNLRTDLEISKTVSNGSSFANGSTVEYEITVENNSGINVPNLKVNDVLTADFVPTSVMFGTNSNVQSSVSGNELGFEIGNIANGASETITFSVQLSPNADGTVRNCAGYERDGCYFESCVDISVYRDTTCEFSIVAAFDANKFLKADPCAYEFTAKASGDSNCTFTDYSWNFGDPASGVANTGSGISAQHTFSGSGSYEVCLIVELTCDTFVCYDTICQTIVVDCGGGPCEITPDAVMNSVKCATNANGDLLYEFTVHVWDPNNLINTATITSAQGTIVSVGPYSQGPPNGQVKRITGVIAPNGINSGSFCLNVSFPGTPFCDVHVCGEFPKCECAVSNVVVELPECLPFNQTFCLTVDFDYYGPANIPAIFYLDLANSSPGFSLINTIPANPVLVNGHNTIVVCFLYTGDCKHPSLFFDAVFIGLESCKLWEMHDLKCCDDDGGGVKGGDFKERLSTGNSPNDWVQLYPNPTSDAINLVFELEQASDEVDIVLYDLTGRRVLVWENRSLPAGENQINWNIANQLETGQYLLYMQIGDRRYTQSVMLSN